MTPILMNEQPPVAHRPALAPHQQYVQWTQYHQQQAQGLPPCAVYLWHYLLYKYPGGVPQEIDLEQLRVEISQGRSKIYCVQSLKNALWKYLVPQGLVAVVKQFTRRVLRVIASHAGPVKEIENNFVKAQIFLRFDKIIGESKLESIEIASSIQSYSESTQTAIAATQTGDAPIGGGEEEELEEVQAAIAEAPFMQDDSEPEPSPPAQLPTQSSFDALGVRTILERLRTLGIPPTTDVRSLVTKTPDSQLEQNVSALEQEAKAKGLKSPIAAFKYFITNNCQPRLDSRQSWWNSAATALGKQRRDRLIQAVFEYAGEEVVMFTSGRRLPLTQAQELSWAAIAALGDMT